jgi:branched-chain amino acid transport system ATP-binding protein
MVLEVRGVSAWWGHAQVLFDVSLSVAAGEWVSLQGLNGAGKSSLLQAIAGLGPRTQGAIRWQDQDMTSLPAYRRAQAGLAWVPEQRRLFTNLTVAENLSIAAQLPVAERLDEVLDLFPNLRPAMGRLAGQLSGGEQQMLALARALMTGPQLLLLDEPCEGIAPLLVETIRDSLLTLKQRGMPMLVAEQNSLLDGCADRRIVLVAGQISRA